MAGKPRRSAPAPPSYDTPENSTQRGVAFGAVIYPNEDIRHQNLLDYLNRNDTMFKIVYIVHDKDVEEDGTIKKSHVHLMVKVKKAQRLSSFYNFFKVWVDHWEVISSPDSYIMYMLHNTPDSMSKHQYDVNELQGDRKIITSVVGQNNYFVQLGEIIETLQDTDGRLSTLITEIFSGDIKEAEEKMEVFKSWQNVICHVSNQEINYKRSQKVE